MKGDASYGEGKRQKVVEWKLKFMFPLQQFL